MGEHSCECNFTNDRTKTYLCIICCSTELTSYFFIRFHLIGYVLVAASKKDGLKMFNFDGWTNPRKASEKEQNFVNAVLACDTIIP